MVDVTDFLLYGSLGIVFATCLGGSLWLRLRNSRKKDSVNCVREIRDVAHESSARSTLQHHKQAESDQLIGNSGPVLRNYSDNNQQCSLQDKISPLQREQQRHELLLQDLSSQLLSQEKIEQQDEEAQLMSIEPPTCYGTQESCVKWANEVLALFYKQNERYAAPLCDALQQALNEKLNTITNASPDYCDLIVEFVSIERDSSSVPVLSDIQVEHNEMEKSIVATYKVCQRRLVLKLLVQKAPTIAAAIGANRTLSSSVHSESMSDHNKCFYELAIENLEGNLKSHASLRSKMILTNFLVPAEFKINFETKSDMSANNVRATINEAILMNMIAKSINQAMIAYYYGDDPDFPVYIKGAHFQTSSHNQQHGQNNDNNTHSSQKTQAASQHSSATSNIKHSFDKFTHQLREGASELGRNLKQRISTHHLERKALVKIIRAQNLNSNRDDYKRDYAATNITCLLELIPNLSGEKTNEKHHSINPQLQLTRSKELSPLGNGPHWDEHFIFNLTNEKQLDSIALNVELWENLTRPEQINVVTGIQSIFKKSHQQQLSKHELIQNSPESKSLGAARVTVDKMRANPVQKFCLQLSDNDQEQQQQQADGILAQEDPVGELLIEITYMEHQSASGIHKSASGSSLTATGADQQHNSLLDPSISVERCDSRNKSNYLVTTEPRPHSAQSDASNVSCPSQTLEHPIAADSTSLKSTELSGLVTSAVDQHPQGSVSEFNEQRPESGLESTDLNEPSGFARPRRSKSFLGALRSRFPFKRSRSIGASSRLGTESVCTAATEARSMGGRSRLSSELSDAGSAYAQGELRGEGVKELAGSREPNEVPAIVINRNNSNALEFKPAKSQLVFECVELVPVARCLNKSERGDKTDNLDDDLDADEEQPDVVVKYYAIDDERLAKKWRPRGTKLHFFNEHQFIARHLASSSTCHNCGRVFTRRPGKQGYRCRNCHLLAHKQCHTKVDHQCPYAPSSEQLQLVHTSEEPPSVAQQATSGSRATSRLGRSHSLRLWPRTRPAASATEQQQDSLIDSRSESRSNLVTNRFQSLRRSINPLIKSKQPESIKSEANSALDRDEATTATATVAN